MRHATHMDPTTLPAAQPTEAGTPTLYTTVDSPLGRVLLVGHADAVTGLYLADHGHAPEPGVGWRLDDGRFRDVAAELAEYFAGERTAFDARLDLVGTAFQRRVWAALQAIPYGETISYGELARRIRSPGASRAVGRANGRNPVSIIVPCHRVIAADGGLGGYGWGTDCKAWLLALERGRLV